MLTDDQVKKEFKIKAQKEPDKYYPTKTLKEFSFIRNQCKCGQWFWTTNQERKFCGESSCSGGLTFVGKSPAKKKLDYIQVWQEFARIHKKLGYAPISRYPVVARWNPTVDFTIASIAAFQPYVVSGEVKPPANPLVIPQFCLRFGDIDNVGITGAHYVGFIMMGEHAFVAPKDYDINKYLKDHLTWLNEGMGLDNKDITIHEDAWAGGGNFGPCIEFFSCGLEISNQVYMQYEVTPSGNKELKIKVLDMGQGQERAAWFTQGKATSYETTFPTIIKKLKEITNVEYNEKLMNSFIHLSQKLKVDEGVDVEKAWKDVAKELKINVDELKNKILPLAALYSIAEHSRALLFAINDGGLPSNVGGMYNLRVILRRALSLIDKYNWNIDICDVCEWHAEYLKQLFPELSQDLKSVRKIIEVEKLKYKSTKEKTTQIISKIAGKELTAQELLQLYDSQGINPELIRDEAAKQGKIIKIPDDFYALVAKRHEQKEQETQTEREEKIDFGNVKDTNALYFQDWKLVDFDAKVLKIKNNFVVLDQTAFYPVSGGQINDIGMLNNEKVIDVFKQGGLIIHVLEEKPRFKEGDKVKGKIDLEIRQQLTQHHTSTHIVNAAARRVLGNHINQAGAKKDIDKAYIDITHYQQISEEELKRIEQEANKLIKDRINVEKKFMKRENAEKEYGVRIYQGGVAPGKELRIVNISNIDVEACGGTHLNNTSEAEKIIIIKSSKVKDGVIRLFYVAGKAAKSIEEREANLLNELSIEINVKTNEIPSRTEELFEKWKKARKAVNKKQKIDVKELELIKREKFSGDIISKVSEILQTQPEYILKTIQRMKKELEDFKDQIKKL